MGFRIIDRNFQFLCELDDFEQLVFRRTFTGYGDFEILINKNKIHTEYLQKGNMIMLSEERAGFIEYIERSRDEKSEVISIKGFTLEHILTRRVTFPPPGSAEWTMKGQAENVIKRLIDYNLGSPANADRRIPQVLIQPEKGRGGEADISTAYEPLNEKVESICMNSGVGICVSLDYHNKRFNLDVLTGKDLTVGQTENPPVIFSSGFDNINEQRLIDSNVDYKNIAVTAGAGEGAGREIIIVGDGDIISQGLERREVFADIPESGIKTDKLREKGLEKLSQYPKVFTLDGKVNPEHSMKFGKDYNLGDIVTMRYDDVTLDTRITEVTESWDSSGYNVECTFGGRVPTLLDKIKKGVR